MRQGSIKGLVATAVAAGFLLLQISAGISPSFGDEPGLFSRIFRSGSSNSNANSTAGNPASSPMTTAPDSLGAPASSYSGQPVLSTPPSTLPGSTITPKVTPKPRVNKPVTEADPLVSRVSLGRSDTGAQFGMFMEVFADGTVIDSEGVHRVTQEALKPVIDAVASGELAKQRGHCGGPAGDFIENVHVIVFDRSLGRLRATSFSYSGNPQGCDHSVHHLQKVLDELQTKLGPVAASTTAAPTRDIRVPAPAMTSPPLPLTAP